MKYRRSPRIIKKIPTEEITILNPPPKKEMSKTNLAQIIITPIAMMLITVLVSILMKRGIYVIVSVASTVVSVIASTTKYIRDRKDIRQQNEKREEKYDQYLLDIRKRIYKQREEEREAYHYNYPDIRQIEKMICNGSSRIYERSNSDDDFLTFAAGFRKDHVNFRISFNKNELALENDPLEIEANEVKVNLQDIEDKPVVLDLKKAHIGLVGEKTVIHEQLKLIVSQLSFLQSYHDLEIICIYDQRYHEDFRWMRWLPHLKIHSLNVYGLIDSERMRDQVLGSLHQIIKERKQKIEENHKAFRFLPHLLFIIDEPKLIMDHAIMEYLSQNGVDLGFSIIYTSHMRANLPENIGTVVVLEDEKKGYLLLENKEVQNISFSLYSCAHIQFEKMARDLSILEHEQGIISQIPESVTFLAMYGVERPRDLQIKQRWTEGQSYKSLAVPLGMRGVDDYLYLNLHEKAHGPHGLIAGTTGSGKSEIIQSYILSLAVNFHPYEVGFLLIDYKGGGMAGLFAQLPHLLGTITNLDGAESMRAMVSIKSELARRQRIFSENNVNHINAYNKLFKLGEVTEPIPHLFLISDEFAELKKEQPEFMKELVSAARIGRSLGVHLILATQKPSGVVDDQIWTNSRFKLALKVQNEADSKEIIKTPDAASITQPGRAYLQVGNNEIYELFQSAWSGATYSEDDKEHFMDDRVYIINELGQGELVNGEIKAETSVEHIKSTELDVVIEEIEKCFKEMDIPSVRRPWLPPLPYRIISNCVVDENANRDWENMNYPLDLTIPIGLTDIPEQQSQVEYEVDLLHDGNIAFFASAGYGKSVFLETCILTLAIKNQVDRLNFYICDFGNNTLIPLNALPHTSDYIVVDDKERLTKLMSILTDEIKHRKKLLAEYMVQNFDVYNQTSPDKLKAIIVVVDHYDIVKELGMEVEDFFTRLGRDGAGLGIYLIVTASRMNGVKYTAINNFKTRIAGYLLDKSEAAAIVGKCPYEVNPIEGRAVVKMDQVHVMQIYTMFSFKNEMDYNRGLKELIAKLERRYPTKRAPRIPVLPEVLLYTMLKDYTTSVRAELYLGLSKSTVELRGIQRSMSPFIITGDSGKGKTNVLRILVEQARTQGQVFLFDSKNLELYGFKQKERVVYIESDADLTESIELINSVCIQHKAAFEEYVKTKTDITPKQYYEQLGSNYIMVDDMDDLAAKYQMRIKELVSLFTLAAESGFGIVAAHNSLKPKSFDELCKWFRTSTNGLVVGSQGAAGIYPVVPVKDTPRTGEGLLYINNAYERLQIPLYQ